ncbi:DUF317 domain-containing protein [Streptomyces sp. NPDC001508]|uniref:DUF317 domain-containing protein n=1 Tax=Streptomyces sp. NPDC001508 TaxID=3154656 RepID=UPI003330A8B4
MRQKRWPGRAGSEQAQQHYLVEPRTLAGGGDLRHVSAFLRASGWKDQSKADGPLLLDSPDRLVRIVYDPYVQPGGWTIRGKATAHQEEWWAILGQQTPVEIVAGLTDALTQPRSAHAPNVWAPLQEQDWNRDRSNGNFTATSPDDTAWMQFRTGQNGDANWWAAARDEHGNGWHAAFSASTPMRLLQSFAAALASPEPVMRPRGRVPYSTKIRTTSVSLLPSQLGAWQQARLDAARAAAWARNWNPSRPRATARHAASGDRTFSHR